MLYFESREDHSAISVNACINSRGRPRPLSVVSYEGRRASPLPGRTPTNRFLGCKTLVTERGRQRSPTRSIADVSESRLRILMQRSESPFAISELSRGYLAGEA
jgi:hypothetical protein